MVSLSLWLNVLSRKLQSQEIAPPKKAPSNHPALSESINPTL